MLKLLRGGYLLHLSPFTHSLQRNRQIVTFSRQSQHQMWLYWQPFPASSHHYMTGQCQLIWIFMFSDTHAVFPEQMFESQLRQSVLWSHLVWHNSLVIYFQLKCQNAELKPRHRDRWPFVKYFSMNPISNLKPPQLNCVYGLKHQMSDELVSVSP